MFVEFIIWHLLVEFGKQLADIDNNKIITWLYLHGLRLRRGLCRTIGKNGIRTRRKF